MLRTSDQVVIPDYFFDTNYKIDRALFKNDNVAEEAQKTFARQLVVIDKELEKNISRNIDFFNKAFNHIDDVKDDMYLVR